MQIAIDLNLQQHLLSFDRPNCRPTESDLTRPMGFCGRQQVFLPKTQCHWVEASSLHWWWIFAALSLLLYLTKLGLANCSQSQATGQEVAVLGEDDHALAIVRLLDLEGLHLVPSIQLDHALITTFVKRWRPETHTFHLPHGEMTITLQDVEVIMGLPIEGEAMVGSTKRTRTNVCVEMLGIQIPNDDQTVLKGQRILIPALVERIRQSLPPDANEIQVHLRLRLPSLEIEYILVDN
uniref:Aminotransferase-like plant mobile domain-containing protein n=1 Tax=Quercus lobata TaxID=97700 RepID=A0A7N2M9Q9_QUELO